MTEGRARIRGNGEGTVYQTKSGMWVAQYTAPNGSRPSKTFTTKRKAQAWLTEQKRNIDTGTWIEPTEVTLQSWMFTWIRVFKGANNIQNYDLPTTQRHQSSLVSKSSISSYEQTIKRLTKCDTHFLNTALTDIKRSNIQSAVNLISAKYSDDTTRQTFIHISDSLSCAVEEKLIIKNPCNKITLPNRRNPDDGATAMTQTDYIAFVEFCRSAPKITKQGEVDKRDLQRQVYKIAALTALSVALRRGETCAIMWSDLQPDGISIERSISDSNEITSPKNEQSVAVVPVTQELLDLINQLPHTCDYVFAGPNQKPISPSTLYHWMVSHTEKVCSRSYTFHELRHTAISLAAKAQINPKVLQTITRHLRLDTLLKVYTHIDEQQRQAAVSAINPLNCKSTANEPPK